MRGLRSKTVFFLPNLRWNNYDIIALTQSLLLNWISDSEIFDEHYVVWRRDRNYSGIRQTQGGGVPFATGFISYF